jgi:hypothetical protein
MVSQRAACGPAVLVDGLAATQRLATADGWVEAGDLLVGDPVLTFEGGEMPVARVFRSAQAARVPQPRSGWRVRACRLDPRVAARSWNDG